MTVPFSLIKSKYGPLDILISSSNQSKSCTTDERLNLTTDAVKTTIIIYNIDQLHKVKIMSKQKKIEG